ncbi:hypothetical protein ABZX51_009362 [Aspergillus tubingensis]
MKLQEELAHRLPTDIIIVYSYSHRPLFPPSPLLLSLPLSSIFNSLGNLPGSIFHTAAHTPQCIANRLPRAPCGAGDGIADTSPRGACHPANSARDAADRVAEGRCDEFGRASHSGILISKRHVHCGLLDISTGDGLFAVRRI